jgi:hypothetical protein
MLRTNHPIPEAATYGGALAVLASFLFSLSGIDLPPEVGAALATLFTGLIGFVDYFVSGSNSGPPS